MKKLSLAMLMATCVLVPNVSVAEDIEIYVGTDSYRQGANPKVMIIFDNSGSMADEESVKDAYDPTRDYGKGSVPFFAEDTIYWTRADVIDSAVGGVPTSHSNSRRFNIELLGCGTALEKLATVGYFTGYLREYTTSGKSGRWEQLPGNMGKDINNPVDCYEDITLSNGVNGKYKENNSLVDIPNNLYPINGTGEFQRSDNFKAAYTSDRELALSKSSELQGGQPVTLYSTNYLRYYNSTSADVDNVLKSRLEIAKETINELLSSTPGVDFGMMLFNLNWPNEGDRDGGRIVSGIKRMTDANRTALLNTITDISAETNTPLCESLMETKRYLAGEAVDYGKKDSDARSGNWRYTANQPPRDTTIENNGNYVSPYDVCSDVVYIILITDGEPTLDNHADSVIQALPNIGEPFRYADGRVNYLPALAEWMFKNDVNTELSGKQTSRFFTIGFGSDAVNNAGRLLQDAATRGGGSYFPAKDSAALGAALQATLIDILKVNTSFTAPSVASNNFDRTRSLDSVYYAMFLPDAGPRWRGNLKKLKLSGDTLVDKNNVAALNNKGSITDSAVTFWNTTGVSDGNYVTEGGVAAMLSNKDNRKVLINRGAALVEFNAGNVAASLNVESSPELISNVDWAKGLDVDDDNNNGSSTDIRIDVFGDPLHSKPAVISYSQTDVRILVGTNGGFLHMFKDSGDDIVDESWAFMPAELFDNIPTLRQNNSGDRKVYGVDGSPTIHFHDANGNGIVDTGDKVWAFFGLRRGGHSYYALDITNPDNPQLLWHINSSTPGFAELGQSWSKPLIAYSEINADKPVLLFGAGYSINKDPKILGTPDLEGRGVFMVDAQTGALKWSLTPSNGFTGKHSVPGMIGVMDSDYDGYMDRLYFADTGGSVWRVDMVGEDTTKWTHYEFARVSDNNVIHDRRFFYEPVIARTFMREVQDIETVVDGESTTLTTRTTVPFDAVVLGSGSRPHPLSTTTQDKLFMLKDTRVVSAAITGDTKPSPILMSDLYAITDTEKPATLEGVVNLEKSLAAKSGWYYSLGEGEKSLSPASVLAGVAYFTSYTPAAAADPDVEVCELSSGGGKLYAFNLHYGTRVYQRLEFDVGDRIPDNPELFLGEDTEGKSQLLFLNITDDASGEVKGTLELLDLEGNALGLKTIRTYIYMGENQ